MSILHSDDLFMLIQSLSKSEKRYFKLNASKHKIDGGNAYVKLFDAIEKQTRSASGVYNEEKIIKEQKLTKHLSALKNRLYESILKSLDAYNANSGVKNKTKNLLSHAEILYEKGLYRQCFLAISKAKELAVKYDFYALIIDALHWETRLLQELPSYNESEKRLENSFRELTGALNDFKKINKYRRLATELLFYRRKQGFSRDTSELEGSRSLLGKDFFEEDESKLPYQAAYYYYICYGTYCFLINDIVRAHMYCERLVILMEKKPYVTGVTPRPYVNAVNNLLSTQLSLNKYGDMKNTIEKLKGFKTSNEEALFYAQDFAFIYELSLLGAIGEFKKGIEVIKANKSFSKRTEALRKKFIDFHIAKIYFGNKDYSMAMKHLNKIIYSNAGPVIEIDCLSRILNIIVCYEMGNDYLFESVVRSTYRFLHKGNRLYSFETSILNFIRRKMPKLHNDRQLVTAFKELKTEVEKNSKSNFEKSLFTYFDFTSWLESKISNKSFEEVLKLRAKQLNKN